MTGKSGRGWNCWMGVKGAEVIGSVLVSPLVGVAVPDLAGLPPPQQEELDGARISAGLGAGAAGSAPPEQHEPAAGFGACTGAGAEQHELGAGADASRSAGSVVTCSPLATRSW